MNLPSQVKQAPLWLKVTAVALTGLLFAPVAVLVIKGLFGLGLALVLAGSGIFLGPVVAEKLANMKMKGLTNEWKKSPIPTLQRQYAQKVENLKEKKKKLEDFITSVATVKTNNDAFKRRFPEDKERISVLDENYSKLRALQSLKSLKYKAAQEAVQSFSVEIEKAELFWNAAVAANDAAALDDADNDPMELLKTKTSLGAVEEQLNRAFAELDLALVDDNSHEPHLLEEKTVEGETLPPVPVREPIKIPHKGAG